MSISEQISGLILPIGILFLGYKAMKKIFPEEVKTAISIQSTASCPRGRAYMTEIWNTCEPGYEGERTSLLPFSPQKCVCQDPSFTIVPPAGPSILDELKTWLFPGEKPGINYDTPIGPGLPGMPGPRWSGTIYDTPIGPGLPGMPGSSVISTNQYGESSSGGTYPSGSFAGPGGIID